VSSKPRYLFLEESMKMFSPNKVKIILFFFLLALVFILTWSCSKQQGPAVDERASADDARMAWWREARFGLFIHWGLYAIPAGEWNGETNHAEWIRTTAKIPLEVYDKFVGQFNPVKFNADEWVRMAKQAGMKYIVITSKHHDGFCLFDSKYTDFDVMSTPFQRDILKELSEACRRAGLKMCWYHSIMDWHHPDYLPRRDWETTRSTEGADFSRYVQHLKNQLSELVGNYGEIGVLWFDGEWENTWNHEYGRELYDYVRGLQPGIIINNRVDVGRSGMEGLTKKGDYVGDFGTPEQEIPPQGLPGVDWETCMTMNDHWGCNKNDQNWKSAEDLIRKLADIASKGGNFLLNVGPTAEGMFPQPSVERLQAMGKWMEVNGEAIYGTTASPFKSLEWGRCTQKPIAGGTRLYLHVFDWPSGGKLNVPGIFNQPRKCYLLADQKKQNLKVGREGDALVVDAPAEAPDAVNSVVVLEVNGKPDVSDPPSIAADQDIFVDTFDVSVSSGRENVEIRYTLDGSEPQVDAPLVSGPIHLTQSATVSARCFRKGKPVSGSAKAAFTKVEPAPAVEVEGVVPGISYSYYEGDWDRLPDFGTIKPVKSGAADNISLALRAREDNFGFLFPGFIRVPADGVYTFYTDSDDGSRLYIGDELVVENDGLHGMQERKGAIALAAGLHPIRVIYFDKTGGDGLNISYSAPGIEKKPIPSEALYHGPK
jgi:alpha-L-fucosidase